MPATALHLPVETGDPGGAPRQGPSPAGSPVLPSAPGFRPPPPSAALAWLRDAGGQSEERDLLTGLATRRALIEAMDTLLADPSQRPGLLLLDLDRFKAVNDSLGPLIGDAVLCRIAQRLQKVCPEARLIARVSGDGFAVLLPDDAEVASMAATVLDMIARPYAIRGHAVNVLASAGTATSDGNRRTSHALFHAADLAMHEAERDGRNRMRRFEPSMQERARLRQALEADLRAAMALQQVELRRALVTKQFELHYQPQVALADGRLTGFEALLRWRHPRRGLVSPEEFIPLAEEIGLIGLLGDWVLRTACRTAAAWPALPDGAVPRVAVNVSPLQLIDGREMILGVRRALEDSGLPPDRLEIELTESALAADVADTLGALRRLGVGLALDDFGTGHSSLGRLRSFHFDRIKIDRSFVADLRPDLPEEAQRAAAWMVRAVASLGVGLGMETVVEGIETPEQRDIALQAGCTIMQGWLAGRPMPEAEVPAAITRFPAPGGA